MEAPFAFSSIIPTSTYRAIAIGIYDDFTHTPDCPVQRPSGPTSHPETAFISEIEPRVPGNACATARRYVASGESAGIARRRTGRDRPSPVHGDSARPRRFAHDGPSHDQRRTGPRNQHDAQRAPDTFAAGQDLLREHEERQRGDPTTFITPPTNSSAISNQQQPTQTMPCRAPSRKLPVTPGRQCATRNPAGARHCRRHARFSDEN